ncbi:glucokinase [Companilactobacillus paralimentarius DSM 13238 = JCM 10415]|uniref:Glucokinase n=3 Tax=Companilactobacillus TaxID=2767879 RepID=A0A202F6U3_9LACO|nr:MULTISPECIES: ROK family glucokinase [Companilactobacillus]KAE9558428.1 glucokinase [Companilactobacillus bobalius]KAE9561893.1 glucokinase [Companilactobacillus paralimentarius]KRK83702.1 glucokinase [Companilactobacillus bobalius DSM 19674]KRL28183.1 glucokinase [Companilactobacillus paralimentarius DSM 13238 = JCM 10415]MDR4934340.1 ROK family glucokinase [Companilactobacillus paralimentarius]
MTDKKLIGVDLGGTTIKFAILTEKGEIQQKWSIETNILSDGQLIIPDIIDSINHHLDMYGMSADQFDGIGLGSPGTIDHEKGTIKGAYNLNWTNEVYPVRDIEKGTGLPVTIENDANVAALGERWQGAGNNAKDVVFVTLGTGVGGGIIANGQLLQGANGAAGEIGHVTVDPNGFMCTCGKRGCLETIASATGIVRVARDRASEYAGDSELKAMLDDGQDISAKDVFDLAKKDDDLALIVADYVCDSLGFVLGNIANTLNPKYVVIGGGVSAAGEFLLNKVDKAMRKNEFATIKDSTELRLASLGNGAGVIGAASLIKVG